MGNIKYIIISLLLPTLCLAQQITGAQIKDHSVQAIDLEDTYLTSLNHDHGTSYLTSLAHAHGTAYLTSLAHDHSTYYLTSLAHDHGASYITSLSHAHSTYQPVLTTSTHLLGADLQLGGVGLGTGEQIHAESSYSAAADAADSAGVYIKRATTLGSYIDTTSDAVSILHTVSGTTGTSAYDAAHGLYSEVALTANTVTGLTGVTGAARNTGSGTTTESVGALGYVANNTGNTTNAYAVFATGRQYGTGGTITSFYDFYAANPTKTAGTITNAYGLKIADMTAGTNNWSIYTGAALSYFGGSITTAGNLNLPTTSATAGIININAVRYFHNYGTENLFVGDTAGNFTLTGQHNTALGTDALVSLSDGSYNVAVGNQAGTKITSGSYNLFAGKEAGTKLTTASYNVGLGYKALSNLLSNGTNVAVGSNAGFSVTNKDNTLIGDSAGYYVSSGTSNVAVGTDALKAISAAELTGNANTAIGFESLFLTQGAATTNTALGSQAGRSLTTGTGNLFLGHKAGYSETGSNKLYIDNSDTATPLIGGDFSTDIVTINGALSATGNATLGDASSDLTIVNGLLGVGVSPSVKFQVSESSTANAYTAYISRVFSATSATNAGLRTLSNVNTPGSTTSAVYSGIFNTLETLATDTGTHSSGYLAAQLNEVNIRGSGDIATTRGLQNTIYIVPTATGAWGSVSGLQNNITVSSTDSAGSSVGSLYGSRTQIAVNAVPVTAMYGSAISAPTTTTTTVGTYYGYYSEAPATTTTNSYAFVSTSAGANVTNDWGVYALNDKNYFAGQVGIGTTAPSQELHVVGDIVASATLAVGQVTIDGGTTVAVDTAWNEVGAAGKPSFENSWVNFDSSTQATAAYRIDALGYVHLKGLVKDGTVGDCAIFTLPAGYRPEKIIRFAVTANGAFGEVGVKTTGLVRLGVGNNAYGSLDGITFKAYQ